MINNVTGKFTSAGTLAATTITLGFIPSAVRVWTDDKSVDFTQDMPAGKGFATVQATDVTYAELSANGVTLTSNGFIIGTACQKISAVCYWQAIR